MFDRSRGRRVEKFLTRAHARAEILQILVANAHQFPRVEDSMNNALLLYVAWLFILQLLFFWQVEKAFEDNEENLLLHAISDIAVNVT